jgi:uncharacterized protein YraI
MTALIGVAFLRFRWDGSSEGGIMKIALCLIALVMLALGAAGPGESMATADGPDYYAVTGVAAGDVLNIRAEPSPTGAKIGEIPHDGRGVQNLGCQGGPTFAEWQKMNAAERQKAGRQRWCRIRYRGLEGWAAGRFLTEDSGAPPGSLDDTR